MIGFKSQYLEVRACAETPVLFKRRNPWAHLGAWDLLTQRSNAGPKFSSQFLCGIFISRNRISHNVIATLCFTVVRIMAIAILLGSSWTTLHAFLGAYFSLLVLNRQQRNFKGYLLSIQPAFDTLLPTMKSLENTSIYLSTSARCRKFGHTSDLTLSYTTHRLPPKTLDQRSDADSGEFPATD